MLARHQWVLRASLAVFVGALVGSAWLGGFLYHAHCMASWVVLVIHLAALLGGGYWLPR